MIKYIAELFGYVSKPDHTKTIDDLFNYIVMVHHQEL